MAKPNIRKLFLPDIGHVLIEGDLKQADAQIVAWESQDPSLMEMFTAINNSADLDIHLENAKVAFATTTITRHMRELSKSIVHATDYAGSAYEIARRLGLLKRQVEVFQIRWFQAHPRIKAWHEEIEHELMTTRSVTNVYGYRRIFFDRVESLLPEALAWKPQSTVALTINAGIRSVIRNLPEFEFLMQVHDSALFQLPIRLLSLERLVNFRETLTKTIPYRQPLRIRIDLKLGVKSWGELQPWKENVPISELILAA